MASPRPALHLAAFAVWFVAALAAGCSAPPLREEPWASFRPGTLAVTLRQPLFSIYEIEADFVAETILDGTRRGSDTEDVEGRYGAALGLEYFVADWLSIGGGIDYRLYEIDDLAPEGLPPVEIEALSTLQLYLALRGYFEPFESAPRWRPFVGLDLAWLPRVDIEYDVDFSEFDIDLPAQEGEGEDLVMLGLVAGVLYQWSDRLVFQAGAQYEVPLVPLDADLTFEIDALSFDFPFFAEFEPRGLIGFVGASYAF